MEDKFMGATIKTNVTLRGAQLEFVEKLSDKFFESNVSGALRWCVDYVMRRDKDYAQECKKYGGGFNGYLCSRWFDLPKSRIGDTMIDMNTEDINGIEVLSKRQYTIYFSPESINYLDKYANAKGRRMSKEVKRKTGYGGCRIIKQSTEIEYARYPQLYGMRRNAIYQCINMVMFDIVLMGIKGVAMGSINDFEKYYKAEVK